MGRKLHRGSLIQPLGQPGNGQVAGIVKGRVIDDGAEGRTLLFMISFYIPITYMAFTVGWCDSGTKGA